MSDSQSPPDSDPPVDLAPLLTELLELELDSRRTAQRETDAEADIKEAVAAKEPAHQTQMLAAGWARIILPAVVTLFILAALAVGCLTQQPWVLPPALLASLSLYLLRLL